MSRQPDRYIVEKDGLIRVDGVVIGKLVMLNNKLLLQVKDRLKPRVKKRGHSFVYLDIAKFLSKEKNRG